jgi:hypothetical protein
VGAKRLYQVIECSSAYSLLHAGRSFAAVITMTATVSIGRSGDESENLKAGYVRKLEVE